MISHRKPWRINDAHERLGQTVKDMTEEIMRTLNLNVKPGPMELCWACTVGKAKQNIVQFSLHEKI